MSKSQVHLLISGKVQGVWYRATCQKTAVELGLKGWVRNLPTGQVEAVAQGEKEIVDKLIEWSRVGPPNADVNDVEIEHLSELEDFSEFEIR